MVDWCVNDKSSSLGAERRLFHYIATTPLESNIIKLTIG